LKSTLTAADAAAKQATAWAEEAGGEVERAGQAFASAVKGDYASLEEATKTTSKAERALAGAKRDRALVDNIVSYRTSVARDAAAALSARTAELGAGFVQAAAQTWRQEEAAVQQAFRDNVMASMAEAPLPFRSLESPPVAPEVYVAYDRSLRDLDAARLIINAGAQPPGRRPTRPGEDPYRPLLLGELQALSPTGIVKTAWTEGKFAVAAA
jgi:hypothetical protein